MQIPKFQCAVMNFEFYKTTTQIDLYNSLHHPSKIASTAKVIGVKAWYLAFKPIQYLYAPGQI
jgi:hypothetical protein